MPTQPIEEIIPRTPDNSEIPKTLGKIADVIDETVNFGSHVLKWHLDSATGSDEVAPITLSFRHILELIDSVSINIRHSSLDPCKILLRSALESFLGMSYILEKDTEKRGMAFMATYAKQRLKYYKKFDMSTEQGGQFKELLSKDPFATTIITSQSQDTIKHRIETLERLLNQTNYIDAEKEYERTKEVNNGRNPNWYSLYDGPKNMEKLAEYLKSPALYHILYRQWSNAVHATDIIQGKISKGPTGNTGILQIRLPIDVETMASLTISFAIMAYNTLTKHYAPDKIIELYKWYMEEIREPYLTFSKEEIIKINY